MKKKVFRERYLKGVETFGEKVVNPGEVTVIKEADEKK